VIGGAIRALAEDPLEKRFLIGVWRVPAMKLSRLLQDAPLELLPRVVLSQDGHFFSSLRNTVANKGTMSTCHRLRRNLGPTPSLSQKLSAIRPETLGEGLSEAPHLCKHLGLIRHGMTPPEFLRLLEDASSPLFPGLFFT
jgi:hypothetical protein